jgi:hypothetical protein
MEKISEVRFCLYRSLFIWLSLSVIYYFIEFRLMCGFYYVARPRGPHTLDINASAINKQMSLRCRLLQSHPPFEV